MEYFVSIDPQDILMVPVLLFSLSLHEFSHAQAAWWAGDDTASRAGRLTMNPLSHIDPVGTILVPIICMMSGGFFIGWAKPVPVNPNRFKKAIWDVWVSLAGPASNFLLVILSAVAFKVLIMSGILTHGNLSEKTSNLIIYLMQNFIALNVLLGLFNLIPIPPLDGSHIFFHFFVKPHTMDHPLFKLFQFMERFGFLLLMILIFAIPPVINPFYWVYSLFLVIINLFIYL